MRPALLLTTLLLRCLLLACTPAAACLAATDIRVLHAGGSQLRVELVDVDDRARAAMLHRWIAETADAARTASGRFPLRDAYVRVEQRDSRDASPVPWGQTRRDDGQAGVLLYVRGDAGYPELRSDWTAMHEFSHLFHPDLGESGRWLAEGLASYFQNTLRARAGLLDPEQAWERLDAGFRRGAAATDGGTPLETMGRGRGGTMRVYWAGAAYWLQADLALRHAGTTLDAVLDQYSRCCLQGTGAVAPQDFVSALDRIAGGHALSSLYRRDAGAREFPVLDASYIELGLSRTADGLRFSSDSQASQLREAIMGRGPPPQR
ncbi:hypothetical protein DT603_06625 [Pseudoxanthomonas gei]|uniref:M61 glycyl aminopeptidase n=1 Tax=Pseudoxanthomonas gei TaxID=1383030 RepID=A0ABX0AG80_9GAMM|nr:hypothetical protein [Pseudoxanthomonas gei]NDK38516.1 hypothetical protein [Pseudoxanthomonas gei]